MKHPIFFSVSLGLGLVGSLLALMFTHPEFAFLEDPLSAILNLPHIYPIFLIVGIIFAFCFMMFVHLSFIAVGHSTKKVKLLLALAFISGVLMVAIPYLDHFPFFKWSHTVLAFVVAGLIIMLAWEFDKVSRPKEKILAFLSRYTPGALGVGLVGIVMTTGINLLVEVYFFSLTAVWLVLVGIVLQDHK